MFHSASDTLLARLHPLVKVAVLASTAVFAFSTADLRLLAGALAVTVAAIPLLKVEFGRAMLVVRLFLLGLPMLTVLFLLSYLWKEPTLAGGALRGLAEGARYTVRFLILILVNFAVVLSTDPREIITALRMIRFPPALCQILAHVVTLLPRLTDETRAVAEAQTARGMRWRSLWRPSRWLPVALPVVLAVMRTSEQAAISLELRGGALIPVNAPARFTWADRLVGAACLALIVFSIGQYSG